MKMMKSIAILSVRVLLLLLAPVAYQVSFATNAVTRSSYSA
jgi:hypothetical protein